MQVDPIKPMLKAPRIKLLKPKCVDLRLKFAFKFNLRRHTKGNEVLLSHDKLHHEAGAYTGPLLSST